MIQKEIGYKHRLLTSATSQWNSTRQFKFLGFALNEQLEIVGQYMIVKFQQEQQFKHCRDCYITQSPLQTLQKCCLSYDYDRIGYLARVRDRAVQVGVGYRWIQGWNLPCRSGSTLHHCLLLHFVEFWLVSPIPVGCQFAIEGREEIMKRMRE